MSNWAAAKAFARLRWRAVRSALRGGGRDAVAAAIGSILTLVIGGVASVAIFSSLRFSPVGPSMTAALIWGCTLLVLVTIGLAVIVGVNNSLDMRVLAAEPLTRFQRALGQLVMAAVGPTGIAMTAVGIATVAGSVRSLISLPVVVMAVATLLVANMLIARVVINLLGLIVVRWPRAGQLIAGLVGLAFMVGYQVLANLGPRMSGNTARAIASVFAWLPGGWTGAALGDAVGGGVGSILSWGRVGLTLLLVVPLLWLFTRTTSALLTFAPAGQHRALKSSQRWRRWFGPGRAGAIATRTAITTVRSPRRMIEILMAVAIAAAAVIVPPLIISTPLHSPAAITGFGACFVGVLAMSNMFGSDGPPMEHEWLAGASTAEMVSGKRRIAIAVGIPIAVGGPLIVALVTHEWSILPVNAALAAAGVAGGSGVALVQSSLGAFPAPEETNPFGMNANSSMFAALIWFASILGLVVAMLPWLVGIGLSLVAGRVALATGIAVVSVAWAYGLTMLCGWIAGRYLRGHEERLLDHIQRR